MMIKTDFLNRINHQYCSCQYSIFEDIPQNEPLRISLLKLFVLKGPVVTIKRVCGLDWHQFFLTNKNRNTITRAMNSPRVILEFHVPFENVLSAGIWPFVCAEYLSCLCCVKAVSVEYKYKHFTLFQLACTSRMFVLPSFLRFFFYFETRRLRGESGFRL